MISNPVNSLEFRRALGCFATGVAIATTKDADGNSVGITISSFNSVSLEPPLILWSIALEADSFSAFAEAEYFAINVLANDQAMLADQFAISGGNKFSSIDCFTGIADVPILAKSAACFECKTENVYAGGDHQIIVGRVLRCSDTEADPLVFLRGGFLDSGRSGRKI